MAKLMSAIFDHNIWYTFGGVCSAIWKIRGPSKKSIAAFYMAFVDYTGRPDKVTGAKLVFNSAGLANSIAGQKLSECVSVC